MRNVYKVVGPTFLLASMLLVGCATSPAPQKSKIRTELSEVAASDPLPPPPKKVVEKRCGKPVSKEEFCEECMSHIDGKWEVLPWPNCRWKGYLAEIEQECFGDEVDLTDLDRTPVTQEAELQRYCKGYRPKKPKQTEE